MSDGDKTVSPTDTGQHAERDRALPYPTRKNKLKMDKRLQCETRSHKPPEESTGTFSISLAIFFSESPQARATRDCISPESWCTGGTKHEGGSLQNGRGTREPHDQVRGEYPKYIQNIRDKTYKIKHITKTQQQIP